MSNDPKMPIRHLIAVHKLLSIGIVRNFGFQREFFLIRKDMSPESLEILVESFVATLNDIIKDLFEALPLQISDGIARYNDFVRSPAFKQMNVSDKGLIYQKLSYLNDIYKLKVYSWNGGN